MLRLPFLIGRLILLDPRLLYWVQLNTHEGPMVQVNRLGAEPLIKIQTGQNGVTAPLPEQSQVSDGLPFDAGTPISKILVGISPLPTTIPIPTTRGLRGRRSTLRSTLFPRRFRLVADFYLPAKIETLCSGDTWAAVVGILNSNNADATGFHLVGASQQIRFLTTADTQPIPGGSRVPVSLERQLKYFVALGRGDGAKPNTTQPIVDYTDLLVAYPDARRQFTLETDIDLYIQRGWSRLKTPGQIFTEITWQFNATTFPQIAGVVFGQDYAHDGGGTASVTATAFRIYRLRPRWLTVLLGLNRLEH